MTKIQEILSSTTFRQSTITGISTLINGALGALFYFLLAKLLGPGDYGIFTLAITIVVMVSGIVDLGSDQGLIRFVPRFKANPEKQRGIIKLFLQIKIIAGLLVVLVLWFFAKPISELVLRQSSFTGVLPLVGLGVLAQLLFSFATSLSQSLERFFLWSSLFIGTNLARLLVVVFIFALGSLNHSTALGTYVVFPILGFVVSLFFLDSKFLQAKKSFSYFQDVQDFNKWVVAFIVVATVSSRLEIFFTTRYLGFVSLGIYGLVLQVANILPQLTSAIGAVTSPKFASLNTEEKNSTYTKKATVLTTVVAIVSFLLLIPAGWLVLNFSGGEYLTGFIPMIVLLLSMMIFLASSPIRDSIIYYFGKPSFFFWIGIGHGLFVILLSIILIPRYNILGTSLVVLMGQLFIALTSTWYFLSQKK